MPALQMALKAFFIMCVEGINEQHGRAELEACGLKVLLDC